MAAWEKLSTRDRITAAHLDIMKSSKFALLSGVVCVGEVIINDMPTAATNGRDCFYGDAFMQQQNRKQVRFVCLHENFHKALRHCVDFLDIRNKFPKLVGLAMDYSINSILLYETDPRGEFIEAPAGVKILLDEKYKGMGWIEILKELIKKQKEKKDKGGGQGPDGQPGEGEPEDGDQPFDEHIDGEPEMTAEEIDKVGKQIDDALRQGKILMDKLAGKDGSGGALDVLTVQRDTDWRRHLREFIEQVCVGDEYSRFVPMNKRLQASGFLMPSHFSEAIGELIIAGDTSGSMGCVYPVLFGEVAQIVKMVRPDSVRMLWWDTQVAADQKFTPDQYDNIAKILKPAGGGGTSPNCVVQYIRKHGYKAKAIIFLSDGYLDGTYSTMDIPVLWGIIDNRGFRPPQGKVVHIDSLRL
jgi:predicted metal-dependent peptidase